MDKRIRDPLPSEYWLLRLLAVNLLSIPLTTGTCFLIPKNLSSIIARHGVSELALIYMIYLLWTLLIAIAWRLRETHNLSGDLWKIVILSVLLGAFALTLIQFG